MLYLSHKAVHHNFQPAPRHKGVYGNAKLDPFPSSKGTPDDERKPMWARNMRNSWHGAEHPFHGTEGATENIYRRYCETLLAVDESTQRVMDYLRESGQLDSTLIIYMGDNGHLWGEQGLIDKRTAYEPSIRVPLVMHCPDLLPQGQVVHELVANIDIAPTILEAAGVVATFSRQDQQDEQDQGKDQRWLKATATSRFHGRSLMPLARGERVDNWRDELLYEYFWERWAPSTPTLHALVTPRWKYIRAYGLWDVAELYDLQTDPHELHNLAAEPEHRQRMLAMDNRLFELLAETGGDILPLHRGWNGTAREERSNAGSDWAPFPQTMINSSK
jgi:N-acetylglucosamine-6-sulfatase